MVVDDINLADDKFIVPAFTEEACKKACNIKIECKAYEFDTNDSLCVNWFTRVEGNDVYSSNNYCMIKESRKLIQFLIKD